MFHMETAERFWAKVEKTEGCWNWTAGLSRGYGQFKLNGKLRLAHRFSYMMNHPLTINLLEGHPEICVCHRCDNRKCVNPSHLFLGSKADNNKDKDAKGRGTGKLTETQVREIRMKYANGGITYRQLALDYGVKRTAIHRIITRKRWSYITDN